MKNRFTILFATLVLGASISNAQTYYPGGVSGSGTNELWFDANSLGYTTTGELVTVFTDRSGNGNDAAQADPSAQPIYYKNNPIFNGQASVYFDGVNDVLKTPPVANLNTNTQTIFCVASIYKPTSTSGIIFRLSYTSGGGGTIPSNYFISNYYTTTQYVMQLRNADASNILSTFPKPDYISLSAMLWNGSTSFKSYNNGSLLTSVAGSSASPLGNLGMSLGGNFTGALMPFKGWLAETIVYTTPLNSAEKNIVENYLAAKYYLTISNDLFAYNTGYLSGHYFDLIGIGQESDGSNSSAIGENLSINTPSSLGNGDYLLVAHDNAGYSPNLVDVPLSSGERYSQIWRADLTGTPGTVTIEFDVTTNSLGADSNAYELLVDADGVFGVGATSYSGSYSGGMVTFTAVALSDGNYFTLYNNSTTPQTITSTGTTTDWHTTTTWDCACVPSFNSDVTILAAHTVDVNGQDANSRNLTIEGVLSFSGSDTLFLNGNLINNGTFTAGTGVVKSKMVSAQSFSGTSNLNFYDLFLDNPTTVTNSGTIAISNQLNILQGVLVTGGSVRLLSTV
ncbi:MAG: hypothetical protein A3K10_08125, partial [Bacteroidetes bacterium RIFCSPLOWO2_12_FULL_31_6]